MNKLLVLSALLLSASAALTDFQLNDIKTLNYALTLEHLENAYYRDGCTTFSSSDFATAGFNATVYRYVCSLINGHESSHVDALTGTVSAAGGVPVAECSYNFTGGYSSVSAFLALAQVLENTGVSAYDGAIRTLTDVGYQQTAALIATVEARHAAYLNQLLGGNPFPEAFDPVMTPAEIVELITTGTGLLMSCNGSTPSLPLPSDATFSENTPDNATIANLNDQQIVNYALTLEYLEYAYYFGAVGDSTTSGLFSEADFAAAGFNSTVYSYIYLIRSHEQAHVTTLQTVANSAITACTYNFTSAYASVGAFLAFAMELETAGVGAYDGAVNGISSIDYRQLAATIATIEARHSSYLNLLNQQVPFPSAYDTPLNASTIISSVSPLFVNCDFDFGLLAFQAPALYSPASRTPRPVVSTTTGAAGTSAGSSTGAASTGGSGSTTSSASVASVAFAVIAAIALMI